MPPFHLASFLEIPPFFFLWGFVYLFLFSLKHLGVKLCRGCSLGGSCSLGSSCSSGSHSSSYSSVGSGSSGGHCSQQWYFLWFVVGRLLVKVLLLRQGWAAHEAAAPQTGAGCEQLLLLRWGWAARGLHGHCFLDGGRLLMGPELFGQGRAACNCFSDGGGLLMQLLLLDRGRLLTSCCSSDGGGLVAGTASPQMGEGCV